MTHIKRIKTQPTLGFVRVKAVQYLVQTVGQTGIQINSVGPEPDSNHASSTPSLVLNEECFGRVFIMGEPK